MMHPPTPVPSIPAVANSKWVLENENQDDSMMILLPKYSHSLQEIVVEKLPVPEVYFCI